MEHRYRTGILVILLLSATIVSAQEAAPVAGSEWISLGLRGKEIRAIALNPSAPSILYVAARNALYEGSSSGKGWIPLTIDLPDVSIYSLEVNHGVPSSLYLGTVGTIYRSGNGGRSWRVALRELTNPAFASLAVHPQDFKTLYALSKIGIMKTISGSEEGWDQADNGIESRNLKLMAMDPAHPTTLFAGTAGGVVYCSTNGGSSWTSSQKGLPDVAISSLLVDPASSVVYAGMRKKGLYRSTDGGATWQPLGKALAVLSVQSLAIDPAAPNNLFAATDTAGVQRSTDGGTTWSAFNAGMTDTDVRVLRILPGERSGTLALYAGSNYGVWKLGEPAGKTVPPTAVPLESEDLPASRFVRALAIDPRSASTIYAGTAGAGIFKTMDGGQTWNPADLAGNSVVAIAFAPDGAVYAGTRGKLHQSTDGGKSWRVSLTDMADPYFFGIVVDPVSKVVYEGNEYGPSKSTDGGVGWDSLDAEDRVKEVQVLQMHATKPGVLIAATDGLGVFLSEDAGSRWNAINNGLTNLSVLTLAQDAKSGGSILYAGTDGGGVFKSNNGGKSWQSTMSAGLSRAPVTALALDPSSSSTVFAAIYGGGVYQSIDAGKTWHSMNEGLGSLRVRALAVDPHHPANLFAGTDGLGVFRSTNSGKNWRTTDFGSVQQAVAAEATVDTTIDFDAEIAKYTAEAKRDSGADSYNNLGMAYYGKGDLVKAVENYEKAMKLDPSTDFLHSNLGFVRFDQGRYHDALELMDEELVLNPNSADAMAGRAICLQMMGHPEEALDEYKDVVEQEDDYRDCKILRAKYYWSAAACKAAQPILEKLGD